MEPSKIHTVVTLTRYRRSRGVLVLERQLPRKTDMNKLIEEKLKSDWTMKLERGSRELAQLQEF